MVGRGRIFLHVTAFLNVDWSYLTSHWSIAVTCINKFATLPHYYPSLSNIIHREIREGLDRKVLKSILKVRCDPSTENVTNQSNNLNTVLSQSTEIKFKLKDVEMLVCAVFTSHATNSSFDSSPDTQKSIENNMSIPKTK